MHNFKDIDHMANVVDFERARTRVWCEEYRVNRTPPVKKQVRICYCKYRIRYKEYRQVLRIYKTKIAA